MIKKDQGSFLKVDVQYLENSHNFHIDLLLTWKNKIWKSWIILVNLHDKKEYVIHIKDLKQTLNHRSVL